MDPGKAPNMRILEDTRRLNEASEDGSPTPDEAEGEAHRATTREGTMTGALLQALISGLATGGIYALVALAFSITFTTPKTLNFGHGEFVSAGAFVGVSAMLMLLRKPMSGSLTGEPVGGWLQVIAIVVATFGIGLLGLLLYVLAVRPFAGKPGMSWVMVRFSKPTPTTGSTSGATRLT